MAAGTDAVFPSTGDYEIKTGLRLGAAIAGDRPEQASE
jgi:hypothetical protein